MELAHLRLLAKAAELGGLAAAARQLQIPKASATRQLQRLETVVGLPLAHRNGRQFGLTEAGAALLLDARRAIEVIDGAVSALRDSGDTLSGRLRIAAPYSIGAKFIAPSLAVFMNAYPAVHVSLDLGSQPLDLFADEADVAIRVGPHGSDDLVARHLFTERVVLCAAPRYFASVERPTGPRSLTRHRLLDFRAGPATRELTLTRGSKSTTVRVAPLLTSNDPEPLRQVAEDGGGIAIMPRSFVEKALAAGALVEVLPGWSLRSTKINAVYRSDGGRSRIVRVFLDHVLRHRATLGAI